MPDRSPHFIARVRTAAATAGAALLMLAAAIGAAWPQAVPPPAPTAQSGPAAPDQPAPPQGAPAAPARQENPGLINQIGKMFDKLPTLKSPSETIDDLNAARQGCGRHLLAPDQAFDRHRAHDLPGVGQRRAGLQGRIR